MSLDRRVSLFLSDSSPFRGARTLRDRIGSLHALAGYLGWGLLIVLRVPGLDPGREENEPQKDSIVLELVSPRPPRTSH